MSPVQPEQDFPPGHPGRADYDPRSPEAQEWARTHIHPLGERDFPMDHPAAADTPGNLTKLVYEAGVDPKNPHREPFTGRSPEQVAGIRALSEAATKAAAESPALAPLDAMAVNEALNQRRAELGRDVLTDEEYREVIARFHGAA
jgi:hypothetical protein